MSRDRVFSEPRSQIVDFVFDETVAGVFPDMIRRSVPGYELVVPMTGLLAARTIQHRAQEGEQGRGCSHSTPRIYDLGCSLGATTLAVLHALRALGADEPAARLELIAVDNSAAMLARAREAVDDARVRFLEADIAGLDYLDADVFTMNWVLQFLPPETRTDVLRDIHAALRPGGMLLVSEKVRAEDPDTEAFHQAVHADFKRANGYSELEISQKRTALEDVMIPERIQTHLDRLRAAGFEDVQVWFRCLNWAAFAARR